MQLHCPPDPRPLILASASPRRSDLLRAAGVRFTVEVSGVDESMDLEAGIEETVQRLALAKARDIARRHDSGLIAAADTLVELDGRVFSKPADAAEAHATLRALSGRRHRVLTGVALIDAASGEDLVRTAETLVHFRELADAEIDTYIRTGEPLDKAGAYGVQGPGAVLVERVEGEYANVVGLPLTVLNYMLLQAGCCLLCRAVYDAATG